MRMRRRKRQIVERNPTERKLDAMEINLAMTHDGLPESGMLCPQLLTLSHCTPLAREKGKIRAE
jgi:hypothetical protein